MDKQTRQYILKLEKSNALLKERVAYLEKRLVYEDVVKKTMKPSSNIPM